MRLAPIFLLSTALSLTACRAPLTEEQKAPTNAPVKFTGTHTEVDLVQSYAVFLGKSNIVNHEGLFHLSSTTLTVGNDDPADLTKAKLTAAIDITSVQTDAEKLTAHLQKEEFFHTDAFPQATFTSTQIVKKGENQYEVTGDLMIKGTTRSATFVGTIDDTAALLHYELPRKEFGIGNDSYGNKLLEPLVPVDVKLVWK